MGRPDRVAMAALAVDVRARVFLDGVVGGQDDRALGDEPREDRLR
jgi:hypothetical protein